MAQVLDQRDIIVLGASCCGKSTIANRILNEDFFEIKSDLSQTPSSMQCKKTQRVLNNKLYKITVIDAAGFDSEQFCRENFEKLFKSYDIQKINLIIFVIKAGRIGASERQLLESKMSTFMKSELEKTSALIFTHCELFNDEKRKDIIEDFKSDHYLGTIAQLMTMGIITTGMPSPKEWNDAIYKSFESSIKDDIVKLEEIIIKADDSIDVNDLFQNYDPPTPEETRTCLRCFIV